MNYREMLAKYHMTIMCREGYDYLSKEDWTPDEWSEWDEIIKLSDTLFANELTKAIKRKAS